MSADGVLQVVRDEDFVEYFIFPQLNDQHNTVEAVRRELQHAADQIKSIVAELSREYIWHKDEFQLSLRADRKQILAQNPDNAGELPPHLYGVSHYGDNIQDEWFIVFLLFEITRKLAGTIARACDSDGEFLLIEAANVLPKWANPDTCEQRVYIHNGNLHLVQNSPSSTTSLLPVSTATKKIWQNPTLYKVPAEIQSCLDERLKEFSNNNTSFFHYQRVRVPAAIAIMLKRKPSLIAPACRAFCERDTIDMKACRSMRYYPPESRVRTVVKFTRCLYAMMLSNNYVPDRRTGWNLPPTDSAEYKEDLLGVKIACGFEILTTQAKENGNDLQNDPKFKDYVKSLQKNGYFQDNLEGSNNHQRLMGEAKKMYNDHFRTFPVVGSEILDLLADIEIDLKQLKREESSLRPSDDDGWLNITPEQLDAMLTEKYGVRKLYKANGSVNATEFTRNITEFLEKQSEFDGIDDSELRRNPVRKSQSMRRATEDNPIMDDDDDLKDGDQSTQINFDPDSFQTHVKNLLDLTIPEDVWDSASDMSDYADDDDLDKNIDSMASAKINVKTDLKRYMDQMDRELAKTTIGKTFETTTTAASKRRGETPVDDFDDIESFKPIDIDVNTLRNMVDSYKQQIGGPGPAKNLLSAMGIGLATDGIDSDSQSDWSGTQV